MAELCFVEGFLFSARFTGISPQFHRKFTMQNSWISPETQPYFHQNFARMSNWSTLNKRVATTQPSHMSDRQIIGLAGIWVGLEDPVRRAWLFRQGGKLLLVSCLVCLLCVCVLYCMLSVCLLCCYLWQASRPSNQTEV